LCPRLFEQPGPLSGTFQQKHIINAHGLRQGFVALASAAACFGLRQGFLSCSVCRAFAVLSDAGWTLDNNGFLIDFMHFFDDI
jgi:hypothetical protein